MSANPAQAAAAAVEALFAVPQAVDDLRREVAALRQELAQLRQLVPPTLVSMAEAARILKVSTKTIRRQIKTNGLKAVRIGDDTIRVDLSSIQAALSTG